MSRIIQLIDDIEDFFEQCNSLPFTNKVVVDKEDIYELMTELRLKVPDEIKKASRLLEEKEKILGDARQMAETLEKEAESKINDLLRDHEIMQQAYQKAQEVIDKAKEDAREMRLGAIAYVDEMMEKLEKITEQTLMTAQNNYEALIESLSKDLEVIRENRKELHTGHQDEEEQS